MLLCHVLQPKIGNKLINVQHKDTDQPSRGASLPCGHRNPLRKRYRSPAGQSGWHACCVGPSLLVQWERIHPPAQETQARAPVLGGPTCLRAIELVRHIY